MARLCVTISMLTISLILSRSSDVTRKRWPVTGPNLSVMWKEEMAKRVLQLFRGT